MLDEFKKFALRGNVVDLAVGVVIGAAFGRIIDSLVKDVIMPPIGLLLGRVDFANLFLVLKAAPAAGGDHSTVEAAQKAGAVTLNYGIFINNVISFLIVAWAVFLLVKLINRWHHETPKTPDAPEDVRLLREIVQVLKSQAPR